MAGVLPPLCLKLAAYSEIFVIDCGILQQNIYVKRSNMVDASNLALDTILEVGSHGYFVGFNHTKQLCREAFYKSLFSDGFNNETWLHDDGTGLMSAHKKNY